MPSMLSVQTVFGFVLLALGGAIGWYGVRPLVVVPKLLRATVCDVGDIPADDAFVVCRGTVSETGESVQAPFTGSRCFGFEFEVTERQPFGIGIPWFQAHVDDGVAVRPFTLDDPTGSLTVVPSTKRFGLDTDSTVITASANESPPDRIQRFVDVRDTIEPVSSWIRLVPGLGRRRYVERRIDPGEEYLIAGPTERQQGETVLTGNLVITDRSPRQFAVTRLWKAAFPVLIALIFVIAGIGGIVI